jgi:hypothetical protein
MGDRLNKRSLAISAGGDLYWRNAGTPRITRLSRQGRR